MSYFLFILPAGPDSCRTKWTDKKVYWKNKAEFYQKWKKRGIRKFWKVPYLRVVYWPENSFGTWQHCPARQILLYLGGRGIYKISYTQKDPKTSFLKKYIKFKKIPDAFL